MEGFEWAPLLQVFKDLSQQKMSVGQMQVELHTMLEVRVVPFVCVPCDAVCTDPLSLSGGTKFLACVFHPPCHTVVCM